MSDVIGRFVRARVPGAHDWEDAAYAIYGPGGPDGRAFRVEADVPTSAGGCWVALEVAWPDGAPAPCVARLQAVRDDADGAVYACASPEGAWELVSEG